MTDYLASALSQQQILLSNPLATVASECVVIRVGNGNSQSILSLSQIRRVNIVRLSHPGLLVLACAAFLIAAGAHFSKDGDSADVPIGLVGGLLLLAFVITRRAAVCFLSTDGTLLQSVFGGLSEAVAVSAATRSAMEKMNEESEPAESLAS